MAQELQSLVSSRSPYHGATYAVIESDSCSSLLLVRTGPRLLLLQEYFPSRWTSRLAFWTAVSALLGSIEDSNSARFAVY